MVDRVVSGHRRRHHPDIIRTLVIRPDHRLHAWPAATYFVESNKPVTHLDSPFPIAMPCAPPAQAAASAGISLRDGGVYGAAQGPRLETAAESPQERDGATWWDDRHAEAYLARELSLCYAAVGRW